MENSIAYFKEISIKVFENLIKDFYKDPTDISSLVSGIDDELHKFGLQLIKDTLEEADVEMRNSVIRKSHWVIDKKFKRELVTSFGTVCYERTHYRSKSDPHKFEFLLDRMMNLEARERFTEDAKAKMLCEAVETSYRRGSEAVNPSGDASKTAVMNLIRELDFPKDNWDKQKKKKQVEYLYIDADEDHVHLQFREQKGDIHRKNGYKNNTIEPKLIYVYEGIEKEAISGKRNKLINPYYFCRVTDGDDTRKLWNEVYRYISETYDIEHIKKIYLNSDGGPWIMMAKKEMHGLTHVLDEFHLEKYITKLTSHLKDSQDDVRDAMRDIIRHESKKEFEELLLIIRDYLPEGRNRWTFDQSANYILNNWSAAKTRLRHQNGVVGSSTEGHVYHVLSSRMSTNPMGWSAEGTEKMCRLRAYHKNKGNMLELIRYQKKELPKAVGNEEKTYLFTKQIFASEKKAHTEIERNFDMYQCSLSLQKSKQMYLRNHLWMLF